PKAALSHGLLAPVHAEQLPDLHAPPRWRIFDLSRGNGSRCPQLRYRNTRNRRASPGPLPRRRHLAHQRSPQHAPRRPRHDRPQRLINHLPIPLEKQWLEGPRDGHIVVRVKQLRSAILPDMVKGDLSEEERKRRWKQLADVYLAQQLSFYPPDYIQSNPTPER